MLCYYISILSITVRWCFFDLSRQTSPKKASDVHEVDVALNVALLVGVGAGDLELV
jgi:hypothetical protein